MKISKENTLIVLFALTFLSGIVTMQMTETKASALFLLLTLWAAKFILVAFEFMEMRKANIFWKLTLAFVLMLILTIIFLLL